MAQRGVRTWLFLFVDVVLLGIALLNVPTVIHRADLPFDVQWEDRRVVVAKIVAPSASGTVETGDALLAWNNKPVTIPEVVEFFADLSSIGEPVTLLLRRGPAEVVTVVHLVPFYPTLRYLIIILVVGTIIWGLGVFILLAGPRSLTASVLHWTMIAFAVTILITLGHINPANAFSYLARGIWVVAYMGVVALFFLFTAIYPDTRKVKVGTWMLVSLGPATLLILLMLYHLFQAISLSSSEAYGAFQNVFDVFQASLLVYTIAALVNVARSLRAARTIEERKRLQWVIWGLSIGAAPFLLFYILPQILFSVYLIPEEYGTLFFLVIAFSFTISFLRYRLLDVELLVNRSIVYGTLSVLVFVIFGLTVLVTSSLVSGPRVFTDYLMISLVTLAIVLFFDPLRRRVQRVVDESIFAARVDFRRTVRRIGERLEQALSVQELFERLVHSLGEVIPTKLIAGYQYEDRRLVRRSSLGIEPPPSLNLTGNQIRLLLTGRVQGLQGTGAIPQADRAVGEWLQNAGATTSAVLESNVGNLLGVLLLAPRGARDRFTPEELDLLSTIAREASEVLERLQLQQRLILEQEEKRRSEELNRLKSFFVSSVSHEFRTPLTAIRMFAETLRLGRVKNDRERREYLRIIEGESERLSRLVENVLDFAKVERGTKEYRMEIFDPRIILLRSVRAMRYQFTTAKGTLRTSIPKRLPLIRADADALEEVLLNLLSNALKYSTRQKSVRLRVRSRDGRLRIEVTDRGIGIPPDEIPRLFEPFYRVRASAISQVGGAGLGLALVKHAVDAHHGRLTVTSTVGKGSTFVVELPLNNPRR